MHMADALISPAVGGAMIVATTAVAACSVKKTQLDIDEKKIPLMGIMGAFIFAAQMINFSIPGTGSSGHLGGGLILAIILGRYAGFLTMMSVLIIQALFFGDGGLLALGCNIFNLGFYTCFIAYPLIFKQFVRRGFSQKKIFWASFITAIVGLQLGSLSVVIETFLSGKTELPFLTFALIMQPIHLAIGIVEGLVTAAIVTYVWKSRSEIIERSTLGEPIGSVPIKKIFVTISIFAAITGGALSWLASSHPDGLEWSMLRASGKEELNASGRVHDLFAKIQANTAIMPDYDFNTEKAVSASDPSSSKESWPAVNKSTSIAGIAGGIMTLLFAGFAGILIRYVKKRKRLSDSTTAV